MRCTVREDEAERPSHCCRPCGGPIIGLLGYAKNTSPNLMRSRAKYSLPRLSRGHSHDPRSPLLSAASVSPGCARTVATRCSRLSTRVLRCAAPGYTTIGSDNLVVQARRGSWSRGLITFVYTFARRQRRVRTFDAHSLSPRLQNDDFVLFLHLWIAYAGCTARAVDHFALRRREYSAESCRHQPSRADITRLFSAICASRNRMISLDYGAIPRRKFLRPPANRRILDIAKPKLLENGLCGDERSREGFGEAISGSIIPVV